MSHCCHFPVCGGCLNLNKTYPEQLAIKRKQLRQIFSSVKVDIPEIIKSPSPLFYRHKVQLPFGFDRKSRKVTLGCYSKDSHDVIDQKECLIQDKDLTTVVHGIREWANATKLSSYNETSGSGLLRHVLLRKGAGTGEILIGIVTNGDRVEGTRYLSKKLLEILGGKLPDISKVVGIIQNVNTRKTNVVLGEKENTWWGRPFLKENLGTLKFKVGLSTFFQVNPYQTPNLYNEVLAWIPEKKLVFDLYSGTGSIALWISSRASEVVGIEENKASVSAAKTAAGVNNIRNIRFVAGDTAEMLPQLIGKEYSAAVVDPPRKGLDEKIIKTILDSTLNRIIYVSCNPQSLYRDIELFQQNYATVSLKGFDMFPQTDHVECVAVLDRIKW